MVKKENKRDQCQRCDSLSIFGSLLDEGFPTLLPSSAEKLHPPIEEDVVDGELFFDLVGSAASGATTPAVRPVKSAKLEVGGKGLPGGGIWKVSDKPRSGENNTVVSYAASSQFNGHIDKST